jgi:hypothetical protein
MPRPGPRRVWFGARLFTPDEQAVVEALAVEETGGNLSAMVRQLTFEALAARSLRMVNEAWVMVHEGRWGGDVFSGPDAVADPR